MSISTIPAIIDALVAQCQGASALAGVDIYDGPPTTNETGLQLLYIGHNTSDNATRFAQSWAGLGHLARNEEFEIPCAAYARSGETVIKTVRDQAFAIAEAVALLLRTDPTLAQPGGNIVRAGFGTKGSYIPSQTPDGALVTLDFTIQVQARI